MLVTEREGERESALLLLPLFGHEEHPPARMLACACACKLRIALYHCGVYDLARAFKLVNAHIRPNRPKCSLSKNFRCRFGREFICACRMSWSCEQSFRMSRSLLSKSKPILTHTGATVTKLLSLSLPLCHSLARALSLSPPFLSRCQRAQVCARCHYAICEILLGTTTSVADKTSSWFHAPRCATKTTFGRVTRIPRQYINVIFFAISCHT